MRNLINSFIEFLHHSKKTVLLILIVAAITIILSTTIFWLLSRIYNYDIPSLGNIRTTGVKAYGGNITLKEGEQFIDWGTIYTGASTNRSFYVKSRSNIETTLNFTASSWTFRDFEGNNVTGSLASYIEFADAVNITWNYTGALVSPGDEIYVTFTLWTSDDIRFIDYLVDKRVEEFSFDMHIWAKE